MRKQLSDEQLDQMMRTLMSDAMVDETELDNIADSPSIWWGVQREIGQKAAPWPPPTKWWRIFFIGVPSMAAMVLLIAFIILGGSADLAPEQARTNSGTEHFSPDEGKVNVGLSTQNAVSDETQAGNTVSSYKQPSISSTFNRTSSVVKERRTVELKQNRSVAQKDIKESIKTDFIALSYADNPESGQIVRVKVPSSMMVTLGLVASVEKPSSLVDAEVLVGDDGLTHSIRFIRKAL